MMERPDHGQMTEMVIDALKAQERILTDKLVVAQKTIEALNERVGVADSHVENLAMFLRRAIRHMGDAYSRYDIEDYLKSHNLNGSPLRGDTPDPMPEGEKG